MISDTAQPFSRSLSLGKSKRVVCDVGDAREVHSLGGENSVVCARARARAVVCQETKKSDSCAAVLQWGRVSMRRVQPQGGTLNPTGIWSKYVCWLGRDTCLTVWRVGHCRPLQLVIVGGEGRQGSIARNATHGERAFACTQHDHAWNYR